MYWQHKRERRSLTNLALHPDLAAVELHKLPAQGEPQPRALDLLCGRPHLTELLEDLLLILWGDADPGVADGNLHEPILWHCAHFNASTFRRELDRIRQEVQDNLPDLAFVGLNLASPLIDACLKRD